MRTIYRFILCLLVCAPLGAAAAPRGGRGVSSTNRVEESKTRLRASAPVVVSRSGKNTREVQHINSEVINAGDGLATGIEVLAELPGGIVLQLRGPKKLRPGQRAAYLSRSRVPMTASGSVRIKATCEQCWR
ncbi:MAG: hypothetical protein ACK5Y6_06160 [Pseudomonadota bacterium]|jgi:hypothetical protein